MIKRLLLAVLFLSLITPAAVLPSHSATSSPAPTKKPTAKPTVTKKPTAKPKVKKKPKPKATSKVAPLPTPVWPPKGYKVSSSGNTYARIPTVDDLKRLSNTDAVLEKSLAVREDGVRVCEKYACGAIQVVSSVGCTYWVVTADVRNQVSATDKTLKVLGQLRTTYVKTSPKQFVTVLLVSKELLDPLHSIGNFKADCRNDSPAETVPTTTYTSNL